MIREDELTDILFSNNLIRQEELDKALYQTKKLKRPLDRVLLDMHLLDKEVLYGAIAERVGVSYQSLSDFNVPGELIKIYPEQLARSTKSVPLGIRENVLYIAMEDPSDISLIDQIQLFTNYPIEVFLAGPGEIEDTLNKIYSMDPKQSLFAEMENIKNDGLEGGQAGEPTPIIKIVDLILAQAVRDRASDIHIEPEESSTRVRFRIDGVLYEIPSPPKEWEQPVISRLKVLSDMDIAESRVPQDGHFQAQIEGKIVDFRVSTLPTIYGENLVLRLLDTASVTIGLERLGFTTYEDLKRYEELIARPYGIILSTGPTGCGKTTTLYSALMRINTPDRNIITLEDPVEYRLGLIRQVQVNPRAGMTFASGLRSILRQDPDVIMLGEIRDLETARMAIQAALTGHLVFSTLHTNDATSAVARLADMGVEEFLIAASLIGVMAQRLVRAICPKCKEEVVPSKAILKKWGLEDRPGIKVYRGRGCDDCKGTGYKGRTGIFELFGLSDEIREMITQGASSVALRKKAQETGMRLLFEDGREKVLKGFTTFEEVARVCEEQAEVKPVTTEVKPNITIKPGGTVQKPPAVAEGVRVDSRALEEYRFRMARWLNNKN